jgi:hypothetical protein
MKSRCMNPNHKNFDLYGGRGIAVCDRWLNSFSEFLEDMGPRPPGRTLDRINNDGDYEPGNCRWATALEQAANKRRKKTERLVEFNGVVLCIKHWAKKYRIHQTTLRNRLNRGWEVERALTTPGRRDYD